LIALSLLALFPPVRWSDDEVERLRGVVAAEARRRGLLPPERDPKGDASAGRLHSATKA
jgi:hypothetical protein